MLPLYLALLDTPEEKNRFADLYGRYRDLMFAVAQKYLLSEAEQEMAVDAALHAVLKIVKTIDDPSSTKTKNLMVLLARHACVDRLRKTGGIEEVSLDEASERPLYRADGMLTEAIASLSKTNRDMIGLRYYYGYSTKETAMLLGVSYSAARKRLERAHGELRKLLENEK